MVMRGVSRPQLCFWKWLFAERGVPPFVWGLLVKSGIFNFPNDDDDDDDDYH